MRDTTPSTDLAPIDRARTVLGFDAARAELATLADQSKGITEITNKAGYDQCHAARMVLKNRRIAIQRLGKDAREDAQAYSKAVIGVEKELVAIIEPEEGRLAAMQEEWDTARQREREAAERAEAERIQKQQDALATITGALGRLFGATADQLNLALDQLASFEMDQFDEVFRPAAEQARQEAEAAIRKARDERHELDRQAEALRAERERLESEATEQRRVAAEVEEARRQQQEREDAERRAKQEAEDEERRQKVQAEEARLAEERRQLEEQQAAQREAEAKAAQERQEAAQRAEEERLAREQAEQAEREERAREEAERAIAEATLITAATEAMEYLTDLGQEGDQKALLIARKIDAALEREDL